jgi:phosphomethylpyrimidine synthase
MEKQAAAARAGMAEKSKEFLDKGGEIYLSESGEVREAID